MLFWQVKLSKSPAGFFDNQICSEPCNPHCYTVKWYIMGKQTIKLDLILLVIPKNSRSQYVSVPYHLKSVYWKD